MRVYVTLAKTGLRLHRTYLGCMLDSDCCGACVGVRLLIRDDMLFGYPLSFVLTPHFPSQLQVLPLIEERRRRDLHTLSSLGVLFTMLPHLLNF